jgi:hypothetical protein
MPQASLEIMMVTPTTVNIADLPSIDDGTSPCDTSIKQSTEETSDEDEDVYLKRLQPNQQRIDVPTAGNEDDDDNDNNNDDDDDDDDDDDEDENQCNNVRSMFIENSRSFYRINLNI